MEGQCAGATEGQPQEDVLVPRTVDPEAQRSQVGGLSVVSQLSLILRHRDCLSISEKKDGLDFFYADRNSAIKMTEFLNGVVPIR